MSYLERVLRAIIIQERLPLPETEYRFYGPRRWRMDMVWVNEKLAVEVEGGIWMKNGGGRHQRPLTFLQDAVKYNTASLLGYRVLRVCKEHIDSGEAILWIKQGLGLAKIE